MEQILQLLLERNERSRWRQGRPLGRRDHRNDGGSGVTARFYGIKEGTQLNKSEFQPETAVNVSETAVKVASCDREDEGAKYDGGKPMCT
ncbi:hypothetical protein L195_g012333 [Trifolium pratense]|uniref:Uncharacterized protein n=1 Tax=Trifolium pratense TaxID=57577 RepID=A0A2K3PK14_TRIPR|nr:hypothetical protein L195_g012333 [Trifolium pratense]